MLGILVPALPHLFGRAESLAATGDEAQETEFCPMRYIAKEASATPTDPCFTSRARHVQARSIETSSALWPAAKEDALSPMDVSQWVVPVGSVATG